MNDALLIERLAGGGDAVGRENGKTVFVPYGAPGDRVRLGPREEKKNFSRGWIASVETPSPHRVKPPCPLFFVPGADPAAVCGGCSWQHLSYPAQRNAKKSLLIDAFQRIGKIATPAVEDTIGAESPIRYRNKVQIPVVRAPNGRIAAGFYAPESHRVVPFNDCLIQSERQITAVRAIMEWLNRNPVAVISPHPNPLPGVLAASGARQGLPRGEGEKLKGWLRHIYLRENAAGEILAALVAKDRGFPKGTTFATDLSRRAPAVKSVFLNVNAKPGNVVLGLEWIRLMGKPFLDDCLGGLRFRLSPGTFFQVNHAQAEKLYAKAVELARTDPGDNVLELYAGVGAMGMMLASRARHVWAVEENVQAVRDGIESAGLNGITNIRFVAARCEDALSRRRPAQELAGKPLVVLLDPPRAGCDPRVLKAVMRLTPKRIVYVSCDPATLARDARFLSTGGWKLAGSTPVDMFPQTAHVESVSLFLK